MCAGLSEQIIPGTTASSNEDLALLVAEFSLLNSQLRIIATECADDACMVTLPSEDVDLRVLSREIPDLRSRLGIGDGLVFGGGGFSIRRIQMTATESVAKIAEGLAFLVTGFRVLGSDLSYAFQIFLRAARGADEPSLPSIAHPCRCLPCCLN